MEIKLEGPCVVIHDVRVSICAAKFNVENNSVGNLSFMHILPMRKHKPRIGEDSLYSWKQNIWTLYHIVLRKQYIHTKDIKFNSVPIMEKGITEKKTMDQL